MEQTFGYDLSRTCDEIRPGYRHVETCQQTVPEAILSHKRPRRARKPRRGSFCHFAAKSLHFLGRTQKMRKLLDLDRFPH